MKNYLKQNWLVILGAIIGAIGGLAYWRFMGCSTGSCPLSSSPWFSSIWGAAIGGLLLDMFKRNSKK